MKSIYYLLIGLLFVVSACEDDKDKSDYDVQGNGVPTGVTTATVQAVTMISAEFSGSVEGNNGCTITENGFVISENEQPTINDKVAAAPEVNTGTFHASITGLTPGTTYYVRTYSLNCMGVAYSNEVSSFTTDPHPLAPFTGNKTMSTANYVAGEYQQFPVSIELDPNDLTLLYLTGLQSAQVPLALGTLKMYVDVETGKVTIPAGQQFEEKTYGTYQYVYMDAGLEAYLDQDISGHIEGDKIYIDDNFGALIIVGSNAGLFHSVYGENVIE